MIVNVAGAGAGKTTQMADVLLSQDIPDGKVVFCIAFTNAATDNIREKVAGKKGSVPENIRISTIHSFLYQELIEPYYFFLFGKQYRRLSTINLPDDIAFKAAKLSELENNDILHITKIPEKAKWVAYKKSDDNRLKKDIRQRIISIFSNYCAAIYVDEAQDINEEIYLILQALENAGVKIILFGDPKQDVKGFGCFRKIINETEDVNYLSICFRCPQLHLNLSNTLAADNEKQFADSENSTGSLEIVFESDVGNITEYINTKNYELCYISKKQSHFSTHRKKENNERFETLYFEVHCAMSKKWSGIVTEIEIERGAFYVTEMMLEKFDESGNAGKQISHNVKSGAFDKLSKKEYAQMSNAFAINKEPEETVAVSSIEIIKGLEADKCLFILTTDLAPYLFQTKTEDNKTSHLLYVALTRSKDLLTIIITKEVEKDFSREAIIDFFQKFDVAV